MSGFRDYSRDTLSTLGDHALTAREFVRKHPAEQYRIIRDGTVRLLRETKIEVVTLSLFFAGIAGLLSYNHEDDKGKTVPLGFSEIEQIEDDTVITHKPVGKYNWTLAANNDHNMKIFECWNQSHAMTFFGSNTYAFAKELEMRMDPTFKQYRYEIKQLNDLLPMMADSVLAGELKPHVEMTRGIKGVRQTFDHAWTESHPDTYRPELKTRIVTDSKGNSHTETYIEMVYDHTDHYYDYHAQEGEEAGRELSDLLQEHPHIGLPEPLRTSTVTHAENEYAIEKSRQKELGNTRLSPDSLVSLANTWATGSTYAVREPKIDRDIIDLHSLNKSWQHAKNTAAAHPHHHYTTTSRSHPGPPEYQVRTDILTTGYDIANNIDAIIDGVNTIKTMTLEQRADILELIGIELDRKPGSAGRLASNIMGRARKQYISNVENGFDVDPAKYAMVLAWMLVGGLIGTGAGFAWNKIDEELLGEPVNPWA